MGDAHGRERYDRTPPQNIEAERSVLGAMLLNGEAVSAGLEILAEAGYFPSRTDVPTRADLAPIMEALTRVSEQFVPPEALNKYTASSEEMIAAVMANMAKKP